MPVCSYGGAKCPAGPGAAGDADTVHLHEVRYHGKPDMRRMKPKAASVPRISRERRDAAELFLAECAVRRRWNPRDVCKVWLFSAVGRERMNATRVANGG